LESATEYVRHPNLEGFNQTAYAQTLGNAKAQGLKIWNMAYVQNQVYATHLPTKHQRYLALLQPLFWVSLFGGTFRHSAGPTNRLSACSGRERGGDGKFLLRIVHVCDAIALLWFDQAAQPGAWTEDEFGVARLIATRQQPVSNFWRNWSPRATIRSALRPSKTSRKSTSATFIFRRVCRAFGVVERCVRFPDNLLIYPAAHCRKCAGWCYA
jgi:hypothetical protein